MADGNVNGTNGANETKTPTRVQVLLKQHQETHKGKPLSGKPAQDLLKAFKAGIEAKDKAQKALDEATKAANANAEAMILAFGDKKLSVGGRIFFPSSRGDAVFYREQGRQNPEDIIEV